MLEHVHYWKELAGCGLFLLQFVVDDDGEAMNLIRAFLQKRLVFLLFILVYIFLWLIAGTWKSSRNRDPSDVSEERSDRRTNDAFLCFFS